MNCMGGGRSNSVSEDVRKQLGIVTTRSAVHSVLVTHRGEGSEGPEEQRPEAL